MIELGWLPGFYGVTNRAVMVELQLLVIWLICSIEVILVTRVASRGGIVELPVGMARLTTHLPVSARQRKIGFGVVELGRTPRFGGVAGSAVLIVSLLLVDGILSAGEVIRMAGIALTRGIIEYVIDVTGIALGCPMGAGQGEVGRLVIECRRAPCAGRVTRRAILVELTLPVVGIRRIFEITLMAGVARHRRSGEHSIDMAGGAIGGAVSAR